jgi:hypothetical protein
MYRRGGAAVTVSFDSRAPFTPFVFLSKLTVMHLTRRLYIPGIASQRKHRQERRHD